MDSTPMCSSRLCRAQLRGRKEYGAPPRQRTGNEQGQGTEEPRKDRERRREGRRRQISSNRRASAKAKGSRPLGAHDSSRVEEYRLKPRLTNFRQAAGRAEYSGEPARSWQSRCRAAPVTSLAATIGIQIKATAYMTIGVGPLVLLAARGSTCGYR